MRLLTHYVNHYIDRYYNKSRCITNRTKEPDQERGSKTQAASPPAIIPVSKLRTW